MPNNQRYYSGNHALATRISGYEHESPLLPFNNQVLTFRAKFRQLQANFSPLPFNSINTDFGPNGYLIDEGPRTPIGNCYDWERIWAIVPSAYDMPGGTYKFNGPGLENINRDPQTAGFTVPLTIRRSFFLCGNFGTFTQWQNIPINFALRVTDPSSGVFLAEIGSGITLDSSTNPTDAGYQGLIGSQIQIEDSKINAWRGSIFVREDYLITAV